MSADGIGRAALNVGIVGCGNISDIYLRNIPRYRGLALAFCADLRMEAAQAAAARHGIEALGVEAILARDDVDVIVNLTVPAAHHDVSLAALRAGKHVFSEKPLAIRLDEGRALVAEASARGLRLGCAPDTFLGAGGRLARRIVDEGGVGRILSGTAHLMSHGMEHRHPDPAFFYKQGGGPVFDMAPYYLGTLVNLLGPVRCVQAMASIGFPERLVTAESPQKGQRIRVEAPTHVMALLEFVAGAQVSLGMSWDVWRHGHPPIELYGTEGSLRVPDPDFFGGPVEITERDGEWRRIDTDDLPLGVPNWRLPTWQSTVPSRANYRALGLADLAGAVLHGAPHRTSGDFACHVLEVMDAILRCAPSGRAIAITSAPPRPAAMNDDEAGSLWAEACANPAR